MLSTFLIDGLNNIVWLLKEFCFMEGAGAFVEGAGVFSVEVGSGSAVFV